MVHVEYALVNSWYSHYTGLIHICVINILGTTYYSAKYSKTYSELITGSRGLDVRSRITTDKFPAISSKYYRILLNLLLGISLRLP